MIQLKVSSMIRNRNGVIAELTKKGIDSRQGVTFPEYGDDHCWPFEPGGVFRKPGTRERHLYNSRYHGWRGEIHTNCQFYFGFQSDEWFNYYGLCPEDEGLTPSLCDLCGEYTLEEGNPVWPSQYEATLSIQGSPLEELFVERGYPVAERQFGLEVSGVEECVL